ncbi:hypothetical protein AQUCO_02700425v1 [Aquilegia coerulea]|uniref:Uncharacterized protein n=1 Tax=Aquilegia coerulea TaxID=218851 RepID=A0A2G5D6U7_AQUCA|nr:hypothetical protein AQUCO_02700425v1 [Aquilegia coerulea]
MVSQCFTNGIISPWMVLYWSWKPYGHLKLLAEMGGAIIRVSYLFPEHGRLTVPSFFARCKHQQKKLIFYYSLRLCAIKIWGSSLIGHKLHINFICRTKMYEIYDTYENIILGSAGRMHLPFAP